MAPAFAAPRLRRGKPVVALLTDFGLQDHYVGTMKGVVLGVCPDASLVDITHDIAPHDIFAAALELAASYRYFPAATVFLVVVDPGVGSARRAIAAEVDGYRFVGPDNGVLSSVLRGAASPIVVDLCERRFVRSTISRTFEGRDRFAPAAGWLARGTDLRLFGPSLADYITLEFPIAEVTAAAIRGEVVRVDRFGNLITNIEGAALDRLTEAAKVTINDVHSARIVHTYASAAPGELCALVGSSDYLEVAVSGGNAAARLQATRGAIVVVATDD